MDLRFGVKLRFEIWMLRKDKVTHCLDSAADKDADELIPMLQSNHSKGDDDQSASRSHGLHGLHGHQVPAVAVADDRLTTPDVSSAPRRSVVDAASISVTPGTELGDRHSARRDSRRPSNAGKSSEFSFMRLCAIPLPLRSSNYTVCGKKVSPKVFHCFPSNRFEF